MPENFFDTDVAERYDDPEDEMFSPEVLDPTVDFLASIAHGQAALELAIGTGRVALPLSEHGVHVHGIELSEAMVDQLRAKPGAERIDVAIGDMTSTHVEGRFGLVYLVYNTIANITTQDGQVAVFENAAAHLEPGGCFVIEKLVPIVRKIPQGERFAVFNHTDGHIGIDEYDITTQQMWSHHYSSEDGTNYRRASVPFRYVWPSELDLMARIAGMRLRERWADWDRSPFTGDSAKHVSVWEKEGVNIFHIATLADWESAQISGAYTTSTRGVTLEEEGYIHASRADQWEGVRSAYYADMDEPLVLLEIDTDLLDVPVVEETPAPGANETFPHVYGAIAAAAVVSVTPLDD